MRIYEIFCLVCSKRSYTRGEAFLWVLTMAKSRPQFQAEDVLSTSPTAVRSREWEGPGRWTEYLGPDISPTIGHKASRNGSSDGTAHSSGGSTNKGLNMQWVNQLTQVAEGLMAKMYRFNQILDYPDVSGHGFSEAFWKSGVFPNHPKICVLLSKKFPEHHSKLQLERVRKYGRPFIDFSFVIPDGKYILLFV